MRTLSILCRRKANYTNRMHIRFAFDNGVFVPGEVDLQTRAARAELAEHAVLNCDRASDRIRRCADRGEQLSVLPTAANDEQAAYQRLRKR